MWWWFSFLLQCIKSACYTHDLCIHASRTKLKTLSLAARYVIKWKPVFTMEFFFSVAQWEIWKNGFSHVSVQPALPPARGWWLCPTSAGTAGGQWYLTPPAHTDRLGDQAGTFLRHQQQVSPTLWNKCKGWNPSILSTNGKMPNVSISPAQLQ